METRTDNEIIAEFMGSTVEYHKPIGENWVQGYTCRSSDLRFHSSWDWLMPVWYKFRDLKFHEFAQPSFNNYCARIAHALAYEDIQNVYYKLTLGIKWYYRPESAEEKQLRLKAKAIDFAKRIKIKKP